MSAAAIGTRFWRWWTGELKALVPARLKRMGKPQNFALVSLDAAGAEAFHLSQDRLHTDGREDFAGFEAAAQKASFQKLVNRVPQAKSVRLLLSREQSLFRTAELPMAAEENLREVIAYEMDRLTPFKANQVYFDHRVVARDADRQILRVQLAAAPKQTVDDLLARLKALDVSVTGVHLRADAVNEPPLLDLMPQEQRPAVAGTVHRRLNWVLFFAGLIVGAVLLLLPIIWKREQVVQLIPVVDRTKIAAEAADRMAQKLEREVAEYNFPLEKRLTQSSTLQLIEDTTKLLPDNTWVQQLEIRTTPKGVRELQVIGETTVGAKLIEMFEQSGITQNTVLKAALTRGSLGTNDRFHIGGEVKARALPEPLPEEKLLTDARAMLEARNAPPAATTPPAGAAPGKQPDPRPTPAPAAPLPPKGAAPSASATPPAPGSPATPAASTTPPAPATGAPAAPPAKAAGAPVPPGGTPAVVQPAQPVAAGNPGVQPTVIPKPNPTPLPTTPPMPQPAPGPVQPAPVQPAPVQPAPQPQSSVTPPGAPHKPVAVNTLPLTSLPAGKP